MGGIIGGRIRIWHYLPKTWNYEAAVDEYKGPISAALRKHCGVKRRYNILDDNDPAGYRSSKGLQASKQLGHRSCDIPRLSP